MPDQQPAARDNAGASAQAAYDYEVAVIGAGPGGYVSAIKAAQLGKKTCIIEKRYYGGTCLNVGCIPTKIMLKSANMLRQMRKASDFAIDGVPDKLSVSMHRLQARKKAVVGQLVNSVQGLLSANKVALIEGEASFVDSHTLRVNDRSIRAQYIIVATGSEAIIPASIRVEGENNLLTSTQALELEDIPRRAAIVGGGVIGVEFAYLLHHLGSEVTVLEFMDHILPMVDKEISALARKHMEKDGIAFKLGARVRRIHNNTVHFELDGREQELQADAVLMAVGRAPCTAGLGAEKVGLAFDNNAIGADEAMRTNIPHIFAIGDVNGKAMLAHTASHEGLVAISRLYGGHETIHYDRIPSCVYLDPEIACIGLSEEQARERFEHVKVGRFPMRANGKSLVEGDAGGMVKVVLDGTYGEILGVHLYGDHVTEMIAEIALAMTGELTAEELLNAIHPHPTVSETLPEAFMDAIAHAIHVI